MSEPTEQSLLLPGQSPDGRYVLAGLVKRTYDVQPGAACTRAEADRKLAPADEHFGDPMNSTVRSETDFVPWKLATDVVFSGSAHAPGGEAVRELRVAFAIGPHRKELVVRGDRFCSHRGRRAPSFSDPEPFTEMELRYERAYGGTDVRSNPELPCIYPRNHLGLGYVIENEARAVDGLPLPNLEDPRDPLTPERLCVGRLEDWTRQPMPQSLGWFYRCWHPRAALAGVLPADRATEKELREVYAQAVPEDQRQAYRDAALPDMDFRYFNGASEGLAVPFLAGTEEVRLTHLSPEGELTFRLPGDRPRIGIDLGSGPIEPEVVLHSVIVRGPERQVDLVWRGAIPYDGPESIPSLPKLELFVA